MINTKKDRADLYLRLNRINLIKKLRPLLKVPGGSYHARLEDGKFVPNFPVLAIDSPWVQVQADLTMRCDIYHRVLFDVLGIIPSRCRECWKIVVRPNTLEQLFDLYEFQKDMGVPCKCGTEHRETTTGMYGGYFYARGKEAGLELYKEVRRLVDIHLAPDVEVILKRYCTEYEIGPKGQGPSDQLPALTEYEKWVEEEILRMFPRIGFDTPQGESVVANIMQEWIHFAYKRSASTGDESYLKFTSGSPLFRPYVTYHDGGNDNGGNKDSL